MKNTTAYYLLIFYSIAMWKPVLPLVGDVLAHTFWQQAHIITVHNENGNDHLHKEIADVGKESENEKDLQQNKLSESVSVHLPISPQQNTQVCKCFIDYSSYPIPSLSYPIIALLIPPPKHDSIA